MIPPTSSGAGAPSDLGPLGQNAPPPAVSPPAGLPTTGAADVPIPAISAIGRGLSAAEVEASRAAHGTNRLTPPTREPWWELLLSKFDDPIIRILIIAAVISVIVGIFENQYAESIGIIVAILLATLLAFFNEYRANQEFDILNQVSDETPYKVLRDGQYVAVAMWQLVVGDIVLLEVGEEVPADGRLLDAVTLQVDESRLTGESLPAHKQGAGTNAGASEGGAGDGAYAPWQVLRGTMVVNGRGTMVVTAVGDSTEIGRTARAASEDPDDQTPLDRQLERLSKLIGVIGFSVATALFITEVFTSVRAGSLMLQPSQWAVVAIFGTGVIVALARVWVPIVYDALELLGRAAEPPAWLEDGGWRAWLGTLALAAAVTAGGVAIGYAGGWFDGPLLGLVPRAAIKQFLHFFIVAVTIIVVAVPEGLPMSVTLSLAYSMRKMTAAHNLVRRLHACETIGAATVICSDKTGTLTRNEMHVAAVDVPLAAGTRLAAEDSDAGKGKATLPTEGERRFAEAIAANSTANLSRSPGQAATALGNPTEGALLLWLDRHGHDYLQYRMGFRVARQWTFSTERKFMATYGQSGVTGKSVLLVKGAPEIVLERSVSLQTASGSVPLDAAGRRAIEDGLRQLQRRGMRTLGFAVREGELGRDENDLDSFATGLTWLGYVGIADPVRPEVPAAIAACRRAGVQVKVVTGDTAATAQEIARHIGLWEDAHDDRHHLTGPDFGKLSDEEAARAVQELRVLSRARPLDKLRLVRLLKDQGQVVAVTGDGTNDAPALNYANVGLAMGKTGTAVAKEASDIILLDDSFPSIVNAVMWGRSLYLNLQRFIVFQLTINVTALAIALIGPYLGIQLPLTVTQILWINLIMDTFAALALATEPPNPAVMERPPRDPEAFIVTPEMARAILGPAAVFLAFLVTLLTRIDSTNRYQLSVFFTVFVMLQFWNLFNARSLGTDQSAFSNLGGNPSFVFIVAAIFIGQVVFVQFGGDFFRTSPLSLTDWLLIVSGTSLVLWVGEAIRWFQRTRRPAAATAGAVAPT